jgi:hypothetical protein
VEQYGERLEHERLPKEEEERKEYANQVGADGWMLLDALQAPSTPDWMKTLPAVTTFWLILKRSEPACYGRHKREGNPRTCLNGRKVRHEEKAALPPLNNVCSRSPGWPIVPCRYIIYTPASIEQVRGHRHQSMAVYHPVRPIVERRLPKTRSR